VTGFARGFSRLLATWFYCGYAPKAPGTVGSLAAIVIAWLLNVNAGVLPQGIAILGLMLLGPAIWAADAVASDTGLKDPQIVVVDEVVGQWIAIGGAAFGKAGMNWKAWCAAFVLFRAFDIWKPPPVRRLERIPGGAGIVLDDVMAGVYAALVLSAAGWFNLY
jgi:phosphatidylglycerophosphatase A